MGRTEDEAMKMLMGFMPGLMLMAYFEGIKRFIMGDEPVKRKQGTMFDMLDPQEVGDGAALDDGETVLSRVVYDNAMRRDGAIQGGAVAMHGRADNNRRRAGDKSFAKTAMISVAMAAMTARAKAVARVLNNISTRRRPAMVLNC